MTTCDSGCIQDVISVSKIVSVPVRKIANNSQPKSKPLHVCSPFIECVKGSFTSSALLPVCYRALSLIEVRLHLEDVEDRAPYIVEPLPDIGTLCREAVLGRNVNRMEQGSFYEGAGAWKELAVFQFF